MLRTSRQRFALACSALRFQAATPQTPIVRRQKADAAAAGVEAPLTPAELALPGELAPVFKTFNAFHRVVGPGGDSSGGLPRCAWGYLFRLSCIMWDLTNAHMTSDNNANLFASKTEEERRNILIKLRTTLRHECDFVVEGSNAMNVAHNLREASALLREAEGAGDDSLKELAVDEIQQIVTKAFPVEDAWHMLLDVADATDELSSVSNKWTLETLGRAGGVESAIFAKELKEMYRNYCTQVRRWEVEDISEPDAAGGTLRLIGRDVFKFMRNEIGVHRVQRVPVTEASGRMQTSTASVFLMPQPSAVSVNIDPADCEIDMTRGSGPGGQGVNSSSNAVRLHHKPSGIIIRCHQARSGNANREMAMDMLAQRLWKEQYQSKKKQQDDIFSSQWGSGERGERMRTYNFPQNRITDHRCNNWTCNAANAFMSGVGPLEELHDIAVIGATLDHVKKAVENRYELLEAQLQS